ncbi:MAG: AAA family ATPase [Amedibacillus dolichus]|uniref:AAA family ATPase n=2 Tax=Amedibacillus dolichus TaxID=31971 RepID=A0A942WAD5_9FIRM|nr:AAA domain-containing protein [Amedibacillus dolichus]MBS4884911.1 AAA family ATPase [Amedibacillus dolichus]MCG4880315.1 AAA domain-containing protein [Amedibacillus dolichus]
MNNRENMIVIKNQIKTKEICNCNYNRKSYKWDVTFKNGSTYSYSYENVKWLKNPTVIDNCENYYIQRKGKILSDIDKLYIFNDDTDSYLHIICKDGIEYDYCQKELEIKEDCLKNEKSKNIFKYLSKLSALSELRNEITGEKLLEKRYNSIQFVDKELALSNYLNPQSNLENKKEEYIPIFPFGCNKSQYSAVKSAFENKISVIQGPPGTGKTQTILNIIANILVQGKTVQVVSNNNPAIENIYEKLENPRYNLDFLVARLGKVENRNQFINNQNENYPNFNNWKIKSENITTEKLKEKSKTLMHVFEKKEKLAQLKQKLHSLELEKKYFDEYISERSAELFSLNLKIKIKANKILKLLQEIQTISENDKEFNIFYKIKNIIFYGIIDWKFYKQDMNDIVTYLQNLFYINSKEEIDNEIQKLEKELSDNSESLISELCEESLLLLKNTIYKRYAHNKKRKIFMEEDLWKNSNEFLEEYPIILSTTFSSKSSLNKNVVFDYLIMDEASQVDITTGALALSSAKNAIIVGDIKQLPNVVTSKTAKQSKAIFEEFNIDKGYQFTNSFLKSIIEVIPNISNIMLKEHYRCHPKIINFCNQKFYNNELIIMTEDKQEDDVLSVITTKIGNHSRDHYNQRQIDVIRNEILPKINISDLGIITPYKNQVRELQEQLKDLDIDIKTVHKFQGREKDTIIVSTVDDEITDFTDDPYLLNVAVSRAKKHFKLVISGNENKKERNINDLVDYIRYNNFEVVESKIYSVFDYLYKQYTQVRVEYLQKYNKVSKYDSENLMYRLIKDTLLENKYYDLDVAIHIPLKMLIRNLDLLNERECEYVMNKNTHVDFLIYNNTAKKSVLVIEVDGYKYHKKGTLQSKRDEIKNHILELYGIPYKRFVTNGSLEKEQLIKELSRIYGD